MTNNRKIKNQPTASRKFHLQPPCSFGSARSELFLCLSPSNLFLYIKKASYSDCLRIAKRLFLSSGLRSIYLIKVYLSSDLLNGSIALTIREMLERLQGAHRLGSASIVEIPLNILYKIFGTCEFFSTGLVSRPTWKSNLLLMNGNNNICS
jgi:hypothetical protein